MDRETAATLKAKQVEIDSLREELEEIVKAKKRLDSQIAELESEKRKLILNMNQFAIPFGETAGG